jgi:transcriptional regulator with XRE-family HTH domain
LSLGPSEQFSRALVASLKEVREKCGISQSQLARLSGVSRPMINHLESGIRNPTVIVVHALASALQVDLAKLIRQINCQTTADRKR